MTHLRKHYELYIGLLLQQLTQRAWNGRELEERIAAQHRTLLAQERGFPGGRDELAEDMEAYLVMLDGQLALSLNHVQRMIIVRSPGQRNLRDRFEAFRATLQGERERIIEALAQTMAQDWK